jgi:hypothetical protein
MGEEAADVVQYLAQQVGKHGRACKRLLLACLADADE